MAVTAKLPADEPATNRPLEEMVPPVAVQVTAVFEEPVTVAVNCLDAPSVRDADEGDIDTLTLCGGGFCDCEFPLVELLAHPKRARSRNGREATAVSLPKRLTP